MVKLRGFFRSPRCFERVVTALVLVVLVALSVLDIERGFTATGLLGDEPVAAEKDNLRRYADGPLTATDFRGKVPTDRDPRSGGGNVPLTAYTLTEIRYETRFQVIRVRNRWTARLISADAYAIVHLDKSWNVRPNDKQLLDHEQGHFDLTQSFALAAQLYLHEHLKSRRLPVGNGDSSTAASRDLEDKLRAELQTIFDEHVKAQEEYDRITSHGGIADAQREQRKLQLARITELSDKLAALNKPSRK